MKGVEQLDLLDANNTIVLARIGRRRPQPRCRRFAVSEARVCKRRVEWLRSRSIQERGPGGRALFLCGVQRRPRRPVRPRIVLNAGARAPDDRRRRRAGGAAGRRCAALESRDAWTSVFRVAVARRSAADARRLRDRRRPHRFTPMFPLDPGRQYHVTFAPPGAAPVTSIVALPAKDTTPTTMVAQVYPTAEWFPRISCASTSISPRRWA